MHQTRNPEPRFDSIETEKALARHEAGARKIGARHAGTGAEVHAPEAPIDQDCGTIDVCSIEDRTAAGDE